MPIISLPYQVQDTVEGTLLAQGFKEAVDWIKLKDSQLVRREAEVQTSIIQIGDGCCDKRKSDMAVLANEDDVLKSKLVEVLSEGLLDSVLPYLMPANPVKKVSTVSKLTEKLSATTVNSNKEQSIIRKKSIDGEVSTKSITKNELVFVVRFFYI